jgi:hypothetical protein
VFEDRDAGTRTKDKKFPRKYSKTIWSGKKWNVDTSDLQDVLWHAAVAHRDDERKSIFEIFYQHPLLGNRGRRFFHHVKFFFAGCHIRLAFFPLESEVKALRLR